MLNSDAGRVLTSDVNPNLEKVGLLSRLGGDSELQKTLTNGKNPSRKALRR